MTDRENIRAEVVRIKEEISIGLSAYDAGEENGQLELCEKILSYIDSMPEEPVSEDLEEAANKYKSEQPLEDYRPALYKALKAGAQWQRSQGEIIPGAYISQNRYTKTKILHFSSTCDAVQRLKPGNVIMQVINKD